MHVHFVIPAFKESGRLPVYLQNLLPAVRDCPTHITIQVVDDGSGMAEQKTLEKQLKTFCDDYSFFLPPLLLEKNLGKGGAVYTGWSHAPSCDLLGFVDADGSIPAAELIRLSTQASATPQTAVFGSRIMMLGRSVERSAFRHYIGRIFATLTGTLLKVPVYDSQCGIKLIPAPVYQRIQAQCIEYGFSFDVELLMLLLRADCRVVEEPIDWHDVAGSKVSIFSDSIKMALSISHLRKRFTTSR